MQALKAFWSERAPREKSILSLLAIVVGAGLGFVLLIEPAATGIGQLERSLPQSRSQAAALGALLGEVKDLKSRPQVATVSAQEARGAIERSLAAAGIQAARIVPLSEVDLQLRFSDVPYDTWSVWLAQTERELGARATHVLATAKATPGQVDIELSLHLAGR
ncbi:MAG TPA: type II secretion system protein M [Burkholderiaceae bacterium]|nr:type II secretion system protein M [Burkholderiaceae bacterium]